MSKDAKPKAKTLGDALASNDPDTLHRNAIDRQLEVMRAIGPEEWDYEADFAKNAADITQPVLQRYRGAYRKHVALAPRIGDRKAGKCLWFADPAVAEKFRAKSGAKMPDA